jgi:tetratricopeptide (TPR) repeat protein
LPHGYKAMNCKEAEERDSLEGYLLDRLSEAERDEFELHYFECESCFSQLQTGLMVQAELQRQPLARSQAGDPLPRRMRAWTPAFVTVALLFAVGTWWYSTRKQSSQQVSLSPTAASPETTAQSQPPSFAAPFLEELARVEPPPYSAVVLRGGVDETQQTFRKAMQYYVKGDYAHAIPGLRVAVQASPQTTRFNFYLGACYLLTDQTDLAIESFHNTISLGDPAYSELAHFYLAKGYLRKKEIVAAEDELQKTIRLHGSMETEAGEILHQLSK